MSQITNLRLVAGILFAATPDYSAGGSAEFPTQDLRLTGGTGTNQADKGAYDERSLAGTTSEDIDLSALTWTPDGSALALVEVRAILFHAPSTNGGNIEIKPSAINGWTALLQDPTDILELAPGATIVLFAPVDGGYMVTAANKSINVNNTDAGAATYHMMVVGTSA